MIDSNNNIININDKTNYEPDTDNYDTNKLPSNVSKEDILYEKTLMELRKISSKLI